MNKCIYKKLITVTVISAITLISACSKNDAAEQAMKDAEKIKEQAQALAADAISQAEEQMKAANQLVGESLDNARAQMKQLQDPNAQNQIDEADKKIKEAQMKANQAMIDAQKQAQGAGSR
jgi:hypothetical protein